MRRLVSLSCTALLALAFGVPAAGAATNNISTVAGTDTSSGAVAGDGGPASAAEVPVAVGVTALPDGGYLIAQQAYGVVRRVSPSGIITTVAGSGTSGATSGDGGPATKAVMNIPSGVAMTPDGGLPDRRRQQQRGSPRGARRDDHHRGRHGGGSLRRRRRAGERRADQIPL